uniref:Leucine-rich repeat-containing N-terminal plant-type domain-containing protein n=1 Tax=Nelumbo nucifera TaxID=4432 RepID=A0A822YG04_NELNU|nr:TPA_asm: hypothetical protein HUJ06_031384 [Nelumbo nucifera]
MDTPHRGASFLSVLLLFLLVSCSLPSLISASSFCNPSDRRALWKIKKSLNIPHYFDSWNPWKLSIDCCRWHYVDCNTAGRVTQLSFYTIHRPFHTRRPSETSRT